MIKYNIVYSCSDLYSRLAGISISSLLKNNQNCNFHIWIFDDNISSINKEKLLKTIEIHKSVQLDFVDITPNLQTLKNKACSYNGGFAPFAKFFISEIKKASDEKLDRVLYIDCDTLIVNSIEELYYFPLGDKPIAISPDCIHRKYNKYIGFSEKKPLCATGIVLFNLELWEKNDCFNRLINHLNNSKIKYPLVDLDLMNIVLENEIVYYPIKYQIITQFLIYSFNSMPFIFNYKENPFTKDEYDEIETNPVIYHFCGNTLGRPWFKNSKHPCKKKYDSYYYSSEWKDVPQQDFSFPLPYKIQYILWRYFPKTIFYFISKIMQRVFILIEYKL